jgi:hypothetical protein
LKKNAGCSIVVKAIMSSFKIAAKREEPLLTNRDDQGLGFHHLLFYGKVACLATIRSHSQSINFSLYPRRLDAGETGTGCAARPGLIEAGRHNGDCTYAFAASAILPSTIFRISRFVRSTNASFSARQLSSSTPTDGAALSGKSS